MLLINFAAFTGNLLMCFVLFKKPRFHTTANAFTLSLTICHVFTSCLVMLCTRPLSRENQTVNIFNTVITLALYKALLIISIVALCAIRRHKAIFRARGSVTLVGLRIAAEEKRANKILLALTTEILLIWMPSVIIKLLEFPTKPVMSILRQAHLVSTFLWFAVPVLHHVTYGALYKPFSREVLRVAPRKILRQNKVHAEHAI